MGSRQFDAYNSLSKLMAQLVGALCSVSSASPFPTSRQMHRQSP